MLTFNEVLEISEKPHLLLGNGFSISYDQGRFSFTTLLESAVSSSIIKKNCELYRVFQELKTSDFESVMRNLDTAQKIISVYNGDVSLISKLSKDCTSLKDFLVQIITNNHPEKSTSLLAEKKLSCVKFLKNFNKIYSLNYDLLLYWSTMQEQSDHFNDGYGNTEDSIHEGYVVYKNSNFPKMNIHYLHGAMHYFDGGDEIIKKTYANSDIYLVDQIRESLNKGIYPIFISEGNSEQKKTKIIHNAYLNHCYKSLRAIKGDILVFGASLKDNDSHILEALLENKTKRIFYGVSKPSSAEHIMVAIENYNAKSDQKHQKELILYDYKTVDVWGI